MESYWDLGLGAKAQFNTLVGGGGGPMKRSRELLGAMLMKRNVFLMECGLTTKNTQGLFHKY